MSTPKTQQFAENFSTLKTSVDRLKQLDVPDLDELVTLVSTASAAYQGCKARIAAVRELLGETLEANDQPAG